MKEKVYIETSIISYLTAKPSRDLIVAANQQITHDWWDNRSAFFDLYSSTLVINEASRGDAGASKRRIDILSNLIIIEFNDKVIKFAEMIIQKGILPKKVGDDVLHISASIVYGFDYLITWNCKHIANAEIQKQVAKLSNSKGYFMPSICTPLELMGE
ncbi:MAG: hypothetical protein QG635_1755 [Bacteroidota bacterium]|nr:hypothetical protein [Bacteroidota bacterium]